MQSQCLTSTAAPGTRARRSAECTRPQAAAHGHRAANGAAAAALLSLQLLTYTPVALAEVRLPPIDTGALAAAKAGARV